MLSHKMKFFMAALFAVLTMIGITWTLGNSKSYKPIRVTCCTEPSLLGPMYRSWRPTQEHLNEIISSLGDFIKTQPASGKLTAPLESYGMQISGFYNNERPHIHVQAFCTVHRTVKKIAPELKLMLKKSQIYQTLFTETDSEMKERLEKYRISFMDGGGCFFDVNYDPVSKKFYGFWVNNSPWGDL